MSLARLALCSAAWQAPGIRSGKKQISRRSKTSSRKPASWDQPLKMSNDPAWRLWPRSCLVEPEATPGRLLINPCGYARRIGLELPHHGEPLPIGGPLKAAQFTDGMARLVVEVPGLGFVWIPQQGPANTPAPTVRMKLADERCVRNEFFEAEIDPGTGGLRAFRDTRTRVNRLGQQLIYNPGSSMKARSVRITCAGSALGELTSEGDILSTEGDVLATFRQRLRAWLGRPLLEMRIEIEPVVPPHGYAWHAYFGARFAWRDERSLILRGVVGPGYTTTTTHPETPDYSGNSHRQFQCAHSSGRPAVPSAPRHAYDRRAADYRR